MRTGKGKIRLALLLVALISLGTSLLSLSYMNRMARKFEQIASRDAKIAELGEVLSIKMLEARREEKNFIIYLDTTYIVGNRRIIEEIRSNVENAIGITTAYTGELDSIEVLVAEYSANIDRLVTAFQEDPRTLYNLQRQIMNYEQDLRNLTKNRRLSAESLPSLSSDVNIALLSASAKLSAEKTRLFNELREEGDRIIALAQDIASSARETLAKNSAEGMSYSQKAQRNTWTLILIAVFLLAYLVISLPRRIFLPYRKISRALQAIGRGDSEFTLPNVGKGDELGELSRSFEEAIGKLRDYSDLKTSKIAHLQRNLYRVLEEVKETFFILAPDLTVLYVNAAAKELFDIDRELVSKSIKELESLWEVLKESIIDVEKRGRYEVPLKFRKMELKKKMVSVIPSTGDSGRLENIFIIIK
jgi:methyl-accepting chemotaxis protein